MSDRQVKLYSTETPGAKKINTTTISNVNPEVDGSTMKTYAQMLNNLTTNTYVKTDLIETTNLDTETIKTSPTIELPSSAKQTGGNTWYTPIKINGEPIPYSSTNHGTLFVKTAGAIYEATWASGSYEGFMINNDEAALRSCTLYYMRPEDETSYAGVATRTIP